MDAADAALPPDPAAGHGPLPNPVAVMNQAGTLMARNDPAGLLALSDSVIGANPQLAERVLAKASQAIPDNLALAAAFCLIAERRGDAMAANTRWQRVRRKFADQQEAHEAYIEAMLRQNRGGDAAQAAQHALLFFGQKLPLREAQARAAEAQEQWLEAAGFWAAIAQHHPDHPTAAAQAARAQQRHDEAPEPDPSSAAAIGRMQIERSDELKQLVTGFESLGHNCEFGLMQRYFRAEPLGLLRFSFALVPTVLQLLTTRFEGVGDPAAMEVKNDGREYMLRHTASNWAMHTRIRAKPEVDIDKLKRDQCRHSGFLRKKLVKDLEQHSKIFVYWRNDMTDEEIGRIDAAVQSYGPNMLMCVRLFDAAHPAGSIEWRNDHLMVAALDRPGNAFKGAPWTISVNYWIHFCRAAQTRRTALDRAPG